ncbi:MAG: MerR family transcriptional regulator [Clostridia bacterium]|nr:MerR family transcriptional regulator [Clostridia bacterium]
MMHISKFAELCGTTVKTLRHYDRVGVLSPDYVSHQNGYRYYRRSAADRYFQIRSLQETGMTLREISEHLSGGRSVIDLLNARAAVLRAQIERCETLRASYEAASSQKRYSVAESRETVCACDTATHQTAWIKAAAAHRARLARLLDSGLNEEQLMSLAFSDVLENVSGKRVCSMGTAYSVDCITDRMEAVVDRALAENADVLLLRFSCSPDASPGILIGVIEDFLTSFQEKATVLFSADTEGETAGIFLEWVCLRND